MKFLETEQSNPKTTEIDSMEISEILRLINEEDATIPLAIRDSIRDIETVITHCIKAYKGAGRIVYVGAGTSGRLAIVDAVETVPTFNAPPGKFTYVMAGGKEAIYRSLEAVEDSSEEAEKVLADLNVNENDIVIGITASGRTPFVKGALKYASKMGARTALIANVKDPEIGTLADTTISIATGPEIITGSTRMKAGSAQKMVLNMISTATMIKQGKTYGNNMVDVLTLNEKLKIRAANMVCEITGVSQDKAKETLEDSDWSPKNAIVRLLLNVSREEAQRLLNENEGFIRKAVKGRKTE